MINFSIHRKLKIFQTLNLKNQPLTFRISLNKWYILIAYQLNKILKSIWNHKIAQLRRNLTFTNSQLNSLVLDFKFLKKLKESMIIKVRQNNQGKLRLTNLLKKKIMKCLKVKIKGEGNSKALQEISIPLTTIKSNCRVFSELSKNSSQKASKLHNLSLSQNLIAYYQSLKSFTSIFKFNMLKFLKTISLHLKVDQVYSK